ncbi:hypothetical protein CQ064_10410 [Bacillus sp. MYb78]|nr:hypothetical protein CQ064_10410 [Bacillus sp. MYb78]
MKDKIDLQKIKGFPSSIKLLFFIYFILVLCSSMRICRENLYFDISYFSSASILIFFLFVATIKDQIKEPKW